MGAKGNKNADAELKDRLRLGADRLMQWQHQDGSWDVGYDVFSRELTVPAWEMQVIALELDRHGG